MQNPKLMLHHHFADNNAYYQWMLNELAQEPPLSSLTADQLLNMVESEVLTASDRPQGRHLEYHYPSAVTQFSTFRKPFYCFEAIADGNRIEQVFKGGDGGFDELGRVRCVPADGGASLWGQSKDPRYFSYVFTTVAIRSASDCLTYYGLAERCCVIHPFYGSPIAIEDLLNAFRRQHNTDEVCFISRKSVVLNQQEAVELPKKLSKIRIYAQHLLAEPTRPGSRSTMTSFEPADASRSESSLSNVTLIGSDAGDDASSSASFERLSMN